jgi:hypothetical protein
MIPIEHDLGVLASVLSIWVQCLVSFLIVLLASEFWRFFFKLHITNFIHLPIRTLITCDL